VLRLFRYENDYLPRQARVKNDRTRLTKLRFRRSWHCISASGGCAHRQGGKETATSHIIISNDHFTKTGSGQNIHREVPRNKETSVLFLQGHQAILANGNDRNWYLNDGYGNGQTNPLWNTGKQTVFLSHLYLKVNILPRQARDKHRENFKKSLFSHSIRPRPPQRHRGEREREEETPLSPSFQFCQILN
jgi:hypothetical protein